MKFAIGQEGEQSSQSGGVAAGCRRTYARSRAGSSPSYIESELEGWIILPPGSAIGVQRRGGGAMGTFSPESTEILEADEEGKDARARLDRFNTRLRLRGVARQPSDNLLVLTCGIAAVWGLSAGFGGNLPGKNWLWALAAISLLYAWRHGLWYRKKRREEWHLMEAEERKNSAPVPGAILASFFLSGLGAVAVFAAALIGVRAIQMLGRGVVALRDAF